MQLFSLKYQSTEKFKSNFQKYDLILFYYFYRYSSAPRDSKQAKIYLQPRSEIFRQSHLKTFHSMHSLRIQFLKNQKKHILRHALISIQIH
jgi:hypothetical protein